MKGRLPYFCAGLLKKMQSLMNLTDCLFCSKNKDSHTPANKEKLCLEMLPVVGKRVRYQPNHGRGIRGCSSNPADRGRYFGNALSRAGTLTLLCRLRPLLVANVFKI